MSKSFFKYFKPFFKNFVYNELNTDNNIVSCCFGIIGSLSMLVHCTYALGTVEKKFITIDKKYKFNRNGFTEFMIIDNNGKHYNVNNSLWYWKWNSIEEWNKLETNKEIIVKYYGVRIPLFGIFPNIIMSNQAELLDSISSAECRIIYAESERKKN